MSRPAALRAVLENLAGERSELRPLLLDAAVAGAALARDPANRQLREESRRAWAAIEPLMSNHLLREDRKVLPWAEAHADFPSELLNRAHQQHRKLHRLATRIARASFRRGSDEAVAAAGRALCSFAVHLDDLVDGEERELFPVLHRFLFAESASTKITR